MATEHGSHEQGGGEDASGPPRGDGEGEGQPLGEDQEKQQPDREPAVDGLLDPPVAATEDLRQPQRQEADAQPSERGLEVRGDGYGVKAVPHPVEEQGQPGRHHSARQAQDGVPEIVGEAGVAEAGRHLEEGQPAHEDAVQHVGHHRGEHRVEQRRPLELHLAVEDLHREQSGADGRAEDGGQAGRHPDEHQQPSVLVAAPGDGRVDGADAGADEGGRALAAGRSPRPDRDGRGDHLERRDPRSDESARPVERLHRRVGAVSLRLRGEAVDQDARDEAPQGRGQRDPPQAVRADHLTEDASLVRETGGGVPGEAREEHVRGEAQQVREGLGAQRTDHPQEHGVQEQPVIAPQQAVVCFSFH
jgi:hypothetical protein